MNSNRPQAVPGTIAGVVVAVFLWILAPGVRAGSTLAITNGPVRLEAVVPTEARFGSRIHYQLTATAMDCAGRVRVHVELPDGVVPGKADPPAAVSGSSVTWELGSLESGQSRVLGVDGMASKAGALRLSASISAEPRICAETVVLRPELAVETQGPTAVTLGEDFVAAVTVRNTGRLPVSGVELVEKVPAGLGGVRETPYVIGELAAGEARTLHLKLRGAERGRHCHRVSAIFGGFPSSSSELCTRVTRTGVRLSTVGEVEQYLGKPSTFRLRVINTGDAGLTDVALTNFVPSTSRILKVNGGTAGAGHMHWRLASLPAGATNEFEYVLTTSTPGKSCTVATLAAGGLRETTEFCTLWKGLPAALLEIVDDTDPVQVGETTLVTIRVTNQGNADLINVLAEVKFPAQFDPVTAQGGTLDGKSVRFPVTSRLPPRKALTYGITAKAVEAGDARVKATLTSDSLASPVVKEESTRAF